MNRAQKISLTLAITFSLGLFLGIAAIVMRRFDVGVWKIALAFAVAIAGSGGIISLIFFRKDKDAITRRARQTDLEKCSLSRLRRRVFVHHSHVFPADWHPGRGSIDTSDVVPGAAYRSWILSSFCAIISDFDSVRLGRQRWREMS